MNKIAEKIISDASAKAEELVKEARMKAKVISDGALAEIRELERVAKAERATYAEGAMAAAKVSAELELKRRRLSAEKAVLDELYAAAEKEIAVMKKEEYLKIIEKMLSYADDGDEVLIAESDKARITEKFIKETAKKRGIALTLSKDFAPISGGVILKGKYAVKNLSLSEDFRELRSETEPGIWRALFGKS